MHRFSVLKRPSIVLTLALMLMAAGCAPSSETVIITQRPEPLPSTEDQPAPPLRQQPMAERARLDTAEAQRFDQGKMWTFGDPPLEYFQEEYDFSPSQAWFRKARLGALRFADYCSASFVSAQGLVLTNHHCARESVTKVSRSGEGLLENGFYAETLDAERRVNGLYVDQLVEIEEVTEDIYVAAREAAGERAGAEARGQAVQALQERLTAQVQVRDSSLRVEIVELYSGSKYSAYTYRRYDDVRLVMAPELRLGFFGGAADNFTYPRYVLDMSFFRVYGEDGEPFEPRYYFEWSTDGAEAGDVVFVVGNPGTTSRLNTVSQLFFERDYTLPQQLSFLRNRAATLKQYIDAHQEQAEAYDLRNTYFSLENAIKANTGQLKGLRDPYLIARRRSGEEALKQAIAQVDSLQEQYGDVFAEIARLQRSKEVINRQARAFTYYPNLTFGSRILNRGLYAYFYDLLQRRGASDERLKQIREEAFQVEDWPEALEQQVLAARLRRFREVLGPSDPTVERILQGRTPEAVAESLAQGSALIDSTGFAQYLQEGFMSSDDVAVAVIEPLASLFLSVNQQVLGYAAAEEDLNAQLARARFALYGTQVPPDATFSLRIADGRVMGYAYNGTYAPPHTTLFGLYDHHYTYRDSAWTLPEGWLTPPVSLERSTPLNLVSTNDITGGNSGSPLLNKALQIVGVAFDSNIQALPNVYLYTNQQARTISVSALGMLEALDEMYDADRLVMELTEGVFVETEDAASE